MRALLALVADQLEGAAALLVVHCEPVNEGLVGDLIVGLALLALGEVGLGRLGLGEEVNLLSTIGLLNDETLAVEVLIDHQGLNSARLNALHGVRETKAEELGIEGNLIEKLLEKLLLLDKLDAG